VSAVNGDLELTRKHEVLERLAADRVVADEEDTRRLEGALAGRRPEAVVNSLRRRRVEYARAPRTGAGGRIGAPWRRGVR
jgi:hypothetical protein